MWQQAWKGRVMKQFRQHMVYMFGGGVEGGKRFLQFELGGFEKMLSPNRAVQKIIASLTTKLTRKLTVLLQDICTKRKQRDHLINQQMKTLYSYNIFNSTKLKNLSFRQPVSLYYIQQQLVTTVYNVLNSACVSTIQEGG